jgi:methane monooxygenase PmoA-like
VVVGTSTQGASHRAGAEPKPRSGQAPGPLRLNLSGLRFVIQPVQPRFLLPLFVLATLGHALLAAEPAVKLTPQADRVRVEIGGKLFTEYVFGDGASRPYCYPICAPDGTPLTRDFPMKQTAGDETDHPWHRSLWFAHSMVNGVDFWNEGKGDAGHSPDQKGRSVHDSFVETRSGAVGVIHAKDKWIAPDGKLIATDDRTLRFVPGPDGNFIDFEITLHALPDAPLVMGDNKDGTMATRVAEWMTMAHKVKGQEVGGHGHIVTAKGDADSAAWGKRADWCDYHAEHEGKTYGIAIFDSPQNLRHPTWWMARDYGLFGANPFGWHEYENLKDEPHKGDYTIPAGGSLTLKYRLYYHTGDDKTAQLAARYAEYAAGK